MPYAIIELYQTQDVVDACVWEDSFQDIQEAEKFRVECLSLNPSLSPQNLRVIQYDL